LFEDGCEAAPVDVVRVVDAGALLCDMPCDVACDVACDVTAVFVLWLDDILSVTKLKPLTGIPKIVAVVVITTVALNASGSPCLLKNVMVWPPLMVDKH